MKKQSKNKKKERNILSAIFYSIQPARQPERARNAQIPGKFGHKKIKREINL